MLLLCLRGADRAQHTHSHTAELEPKRINSTTRTQLEVACHDHTQCQACRQVDEKVDMEVLFPHQVHGGLVALALEEEEEEEEEATSNSSSSISSCLPSPGQHLQVPPRSTRHG